MSQPSEIEQSKGITNPLVLINTAIEKGIDPERLGKLLDLQERWEKNRAREAFSQAMTLCQAEMPIVVEDSENQHTRSRYASLDAVNRVCKPCYTGHGFSIQFSEGQAKVDSEVRILADVMHAGGHERQYFIDLPRDGVGAKGGATAMNALQGKGSTFSYGQRYLVKMVFNLTISGEDNDGNGAPGGLSDEQTVQLNTLIDECLSKGRTEKSMQDFWNFIFLEDNTKRRMHEMKPSDFGRAKEDLQKWIKKYGKKE